MAKKVLVFLAEGLEEVEAVTPIDYLRRAGIEVTSASIGPNKTVKGAHGISLMADTSITELGAGKRLSPDAWDALVIPGGQPGADNLAACAPVGKLYQEMAAAGKTIAAICASPAVVLAPLGLLSGKKCTCYPGLEAKLSAGGGKPSKDKVVVDGNLITSRGPGTAHAFALALIEKLSGPAEAKKLAAAALL
jgi:4-methyl-5(b-hydroxyethyl)-thiazole monophosphate biosynthesis